MASYDQLPGTLNLSFRRGDDLSVGVDFNPVSLTGYTMTSTIRSVVTGESVASFTTTLTDAAAGKVNIALSDTQTLSLAPATYRWVMEGTQGGLTRTYLNGYVEVTR
jgi:hypothetical protein